MKQETEIIGGITFFFTLIGGITEEGLAHSFVERSIKARLDRRIRSGISRYNSTDLKTSVTL